MHVQDEPHLVNEAISLSFSLQSEIGFGKLETYIKLDKLGEVKCESVSCASAVRNRDVKGALCMFFFYCFGWMSCEEADAIV